MRISRDDIPGVPQLDIRETVTDSIVWRFKLFIIAALAGVAAITFAVAGLVLLLLMALDGAVLGVVGAALMLAVGIVIGLADYLWLTV